MYGRIKMRHSESNPFFLSVFSLLLLLFQDSVQIIKVEGTPVRGG